MKEIIKKYKGYIIFAVLMTAALIAAFFFASNGNNAAEGDTPSAVSSETASASPQSDVISETSLSSSENSTTSSSDQKNSTVSNDQPSSLPQSSAEKNSRIAVISSEVSESSEQQKEDHSETEQSVVQEHSTEPVESSEDTHTSHNNIPSGSSSSQSSSVSSVVSSRQESVKSSTPESADKEIVADSHCTILISCRTAIDNDSLDKRKREYLPADGLILPDTEFGFAAGESVFDVLKRACMEKGIVLSAPLTPLYGGAYIEGISDLHERDCGPVSGWMYSVNGQFPSVGCSSYKLKDGDRLELLYTCDLGKDIGNIYMGG